MTLMRQLDPTGVVARQNHRLTRRVYFSKVYYVPARFNIHTV